jgi:2-keto-4-pentenoate hydratase
LGHHLRGVAGVRTRETSRALLPLAGDLVTTGAVTGIHDIVGGQEALADFGTLGAIRCRAVDARTIASTAGFA